MFVTKLAAVLNAESRVARTCGLPAARVQALVDRRTEEPLAGWLSEPRVNVLLLNLDLDEALSR